MYTLFLFLDLEVRPVPRYLKKLDVTHQVVQAVELVLGALETHMHG